jgi:hypothetical protein
LNEDATVVSGDIARLAGVGRAAVSNWRRRFADFPQPVGGTSANPLFSLAEVEAWLRKQGKLRDLPVDELTWQRIRNSVDDLGLARLVASLAAYVSTGTAGGLDTGLREAVEALVAERGPEKVVEFLHARYLAAHSRRVQPMPAEVAEFVTGLVGGAGTVLDPSCGFGEMLLEAAAGAARLLGQERDTASARLALARLDVRGRAAEVHHGDALRNDAFPGVEADAVVCNPPFGERDWGHEELAHDPRWQYGLPPRGEPELAWVQHCLAHLRPGGLAAVLMPPAAAGRRPGRGVRARLLRAGALQAVIALPAGSAPQSTTIAHLWLLRRPTPDDLVPAHVLMVDATGGLSRDAVREMWRAFRRGATVDGAEGRAVPVIDLLDETVDVTPAVHLRRLAAVQVASVDVTLDRLRELAVRLARGIPRVRPEDRPRTMTTIAELARAGTVSLEQTPARPHPGPGHLPLLTVNDVTLGRRPTVRGSGPVATPGDIVMTAAPRETAARVLIEKVALGPHLYLIRVDEESFDPYFVAAFLRETGNSRTDIRRTRLPRLPLAEQRRYGQAFKELAEFEETLRGVTETGELLTRLIARGLVHGGLRPGGHQG